jgi:hypothetical protein
LLLLLFNYVQTAIGLIIFIVIIIVFTLKPNKEKASVFQNYEYWAWGEFEQQAWGGTPHCYLAFGEPFFNGLFYRKIEVFEYNCDTGNTESVNFQIPKNVQLDDCIYDKNKGILYDLKEGKMYKQNLK